MTERCPRCARPTCLCGAVAPIPTKTAVTILQHPGERRHAFNTARLVEQALPAATRVVAWPDRAGRMAARPPLSPHAALLYPSADAALLGPDAPYDHLVVLDGTWSQVRRLIRDNPWLESLPAVRLEPATPSRYRIREEPAPHCLSTIESTAMALRALEPDNRDLDRMLEGFDAMVDDHLAASRAPSGRHKARAQTLVDLLRRRDRAVIVYAESLGLFGRGERPALLQWTAVRLDDGALFDGLVAPPPDANPCVLREMDLDVTSCESMDSLRSRWSTFIRPGDVGFAWSPHTRHLVPSPGLPVHGMKATAVQRLGLAPGELADRLVSEPLPVRGRAARRLAQARALAHALVA